jgi:hypothetical protein
MHTNHPVRKPAALWLLLAAVVLAAVVAFTAPTSVVLGGETDAPGSPAAPVTFGGG